MMVMMFIMTMILIMIMIMIIMIIILIILIILIMIIIIIIIIIITMKINDNNHIHEKQIHIFLFWANQSQHQSLTAKSTPTRYDRSPNSHQLMFDYCLSSNIPRSLSCEPGRPARDVGQAKRTRAFPIFVMGCSCSLPARCIMCAMCWNPMQTSGLLIH